MRKNCVFRVQSKLVFSVTLDESNQYIRVLLRTDHKEIEEIDCFVAIIRVHRRHRDHTDARCIIVNQCVFCVVQTSLSRLSITALVSLMVLLSVHHHFVGTHQFGNFFIHFSSFLTSQGKRSEITSCLFLKRSPYPCHHRPWLWVTSAFSPISNCVARSATCVAPLDLSDPASKGIQVGTLWVLLTDRQLSSRDEDLPADNRSKLCSLNDCWKSNPTELTDNSKLTDTNSANASLSCSRPSSGPSAPDCFSCGLTFVTSPVSDEPFPRKLSCSC